MKAKGRKFSAPPAPLWRPLLLFPHPQWASLSMAMPSLLLSALIILRANVAGGFQRYGESSWKGERRPLFVVDSIKPLCYIESFPEMALSRRTRGKDQEAGAYGEGLYFKEVVPFPVCACRHLDRGVYHPPPHRRPDGPADAHGCHPGADRPVPPGDGLQ